MENSQLIYIANNRPALCIKVESWLMIIVSFKKKDIGKIKLMDKYKPWNSNDDSFKKYLSLSKFCQRSI